MDGQTAELQSLLNTNRKFNIVNPKDRLWTAF